MVLQIGYMDTAIPYRCSGSAQATRQFRRRIRLERIARRDQPPHSIKPEAFQRLHSDMNMACMRRIK
jgi:hypothetical protein